MADAPDPGNAGLYSSADRHRSSVRRQTIIAVCGSFAEMVSDSATIARSFHRARPTPRALPQPEHSVKVCSLARCARRSSPRESHLAGFNSMPLDSWTSGFVVRGATKLFVFSKGYSFI